jgi:LacI family fructose operon transcriptional repressor
MPSIKDVADAAGVSTATVSRVLTNKPHVRQEIRDRVLTVVEELDYRPNRVARSLRVQKSNVIGLIVADIQNPFFTAVSRSVEDLAYQHQLSIFLCNTDENPTKEKIYLDLMRDENVAGIILAPTQKLAESFAQTDPFPIPIVAIDRKMHDANIDSVLIDNVQAAYKITKHLLDDGHRRIAALFGLDSFTGTERHAGYLRALSEYGIEQASASVHFVRPKEDGGYKTTQELLNQPEPPDAILTSNALLLEGAYRALSESSLTMPDEIALAGFDDPRWTILVKPQVTVIQQPVYEIGKVASELLLERIANPDRPAREIVLQSKLIVRQSCGHHA